jgi:(E)-4-hydroxy-3-methylbut-2-enyl-diphosphate synthase
MSKIVKIGNTAIGGGSKIAIQSMCNIKTEKTDQIVEQILELERAGCDIIRVSVKDEQDAKALKTIKQKISIPLVADIHFDYRLAILSMENGVDKIRINPGNIGSEDKVKAVADCIKAHKVAVRVGSNSGSLEKEFLDKYGKSEISLAESALKRVSQLEKYGVDNIVISAKTSSVPLNIKTYRYLSQKTDYPLHVGVTEAGTKEMGVIKSAIGIGSL